MARADDGELSPRQWLSATLRAERARARLWQPDVQAATGIAQSSLSRIESGQYLPKAAQIEALAELYGIRPRLLQRLLEIEEMLRPGTRPGPTMLQDPAHVHQLWLRLDKASPLARAFVPGFLPGGLQTKDYIRAIFTQHGPANKQAVAHRLARAQILTRPDRARTMIFPEGALYWRAGSDAMMADQLGHAANVAVMDPGRIRVGIIPADRVVDRFPTHSFDIFGPADPQATDDVTAIVGIWTGTLTLNRRSQIAALIDLYDHLERLAIFGTEAAELIFSVRRDLYT